MSGTFSAGGLITGLDSNTLIRQLIQLERQPILRMQERISGLETQRDAVRELRTQLLSLRSAAQNFRFSNVFNQYKTTSSEEKVLTAETAGPNPVIGSYTLDVQQLASSTVARSGGTLGSPINTSVALNSSGMAREVSAGTFKINGVELTIDPETQSLDTILNMITSSAAGVNATYDTATDKILLENKNAGDTSVINLGSSDDSSNFLEVTALRNATQYTGTNGSTVATGTRHLGSIDPGAKISEISFAGGPVSAGDFRINGISITVDPEGTLSDLLMAITDSDAGVSATYDSSTDQIRFVSKSLGSRTIGFSDGTSGFLAAANLTTAVQEPGKDSQFSINGGAVQTRNSNEVTDAVGDITLKFLSVGQSTLSVSGDDDKIVEDINAFLTAFNESVDKIAELTGEEGNLQNDFSIRSIDSLLRNMVFSIVQGAGGDFSSLAGIGISTGDSFDSTAVAHLELDADEFKKALRTNRLNVSNLFHNLGKTGIADQIFEYVDGATKVTGFLNNRSKSNGSLDQQIQSINDQIAQMEVRVTNKEARLRKQFAQLEQLSSTYQSQSSSLSALAYRF